MLGFKQIFVRSYTVFLNRHYRLRSVDGFVGSNLVLSYFGKVAFIFVICLRESMLGSKINMEFDADDIEDLSKI